MIKTRSFGYVRANIIPLVLVEILFRTWRDPFIGAIRVVDSFRLRRSLGGVERPGFAEGLRYGTVRLRWQIERRHLTRIFE